mmetsp:Transcript_150899/g.484958  ORF Transcript_150899/g.484958 Transcript_150899/m.484958 type:complete len:393 (-) Transcript_150899:211-1389(-)
MLVTVHTLDRQLVAVEPQPALPDLHGAEADAHPQGLGYGSLLAGLPQGHNQRVEIGNLGAPKPNAFHSTGAAGHCHLGCSGGRRQVKSRDPCNCISLLTSRVELAMQCSTSKKCRSRCGEFRVDLQQAVCESPDLHIPNVLCWPRVRVHVSCNASQPPHVLILQVSPGGPTQHLHGQDVPAGRHLAREPELRRQLAVCREAELSAVEPGAAAAAHRADVQVDLEALVQPLLRHIEAPTVCARWIVVGILAPKSDPRRVGVEIVDDVGVDWITVTVQLPISRHRHLAPGGVVERGLRKALGHLPSPRRPSEFPGAVQIQEAPRSPLLCTPESQGLILEGEKSRPGGLPAPADGPRVKPLAALLSGRRRHGSDAATACPCKWPAARDEDPRRPC